MKQPYKRRPATQWSAPIFLFRTGLSRLGALLFGLGLTLGARAQQRAPQFFRADDAARTAAKASPLAAALLHAQPLTLDVAALRAALAAAPAEALAGRAPLVIALPLPNGGTGRFAVHEAPVMAPALAARFPGIKTYAGVGLDESSASLRLDLSPQGFHAQVLTGSGNSFYIDPVREGDARHYLAFYRKDMNRAAAGAALVCAFEPSATDLKATAARLAAQGSAARASGSQLRTYRLALACTPEYALTKGNTVADVMAGEVATVNRVVGVYEKELAVRMVLVPDNDQLIFLSGTGPQPSPVYSNSNGNALLAQNQSNIDRIIGTANYDIGHVVSTGGGGVAGLGVVCNPNRKAYGVTGSPNPVGDAFDIDYVAHEMGHQFAGNHPFNGDAGNCAGGNRNPNTAWEPGSGSTIMAYAGICGSTNNLQPSSDPTFHTGNYQEMRAFIDGTSCGTSALTGNTAPTVTAPASGKTLPIGTPFKLTAAATDAENDPLTYSWEELDLGPTGSPTAVQVPGQNIPLFRSFNPTASNTRYFPRLSNLVNNTTVIGERLPTVTRVLTFRCTARDEHRGPVGVIGGVDFSPLVTLNVTRTAGPFVLTAPTTAVTWTGGAAQTVTWEVAGTTNAPVSCALVNLRLSFDGGLTYPVVLAANEVNDGSAVVVAPSPATAETRARVMVEAADNYFFDISNVNFTITPPAVGPTITSFSPPGGLAGTLVTVLGSNFTAATAVSFNGTAAASFTVASATQLTATVAVGTTTGPLTVTAATGTGTSATSFVVGPPPVVTGFTPTTGPVGAVVVITGTDLNGATRVTFNGINAPTFTVNSATQITATVPVNATTGPIAVTTAVNTGTSTAIFTVIPAPVITSFSPAGGPAGTIVVLTGDNFTGTTQVTFNGTVAPVFVVNSATQLTVTVPLGATTGLITVTATGGPGSSTTSFLIPPANDLCANAQPLACGLTLSGTTVGATATDDPTGSCTVRVDAGGVFYSIAGTGASITVSTCGAGTNYDSKLFVYSGTCGAYVCVGGNDDAGGSCGEASAVTFNSVVGTSYLIFVSGYLTETGNFVLSATCATPPPAPVITSLAPDSGPVTSSVVITGTNFTGATRVTFNGLVASFTVVDAATVSTIVPNGATTGNVVVTTAGGPSNGVLFTVTNPVPVISRIVAASAAVGETVTISGSGFGGASSLTFNGIVATNYTVTSATSITAVVPSGATTGNVVVTTPGGVSNGQPFTVAVVSATANTNRSEFSVWPNPIAAAGILRVSLAVPAAVARLSLHNVLGQLVSTHAFKGSSTELSTAGLAAGTYLLVVQTAGRAPSTQRIVVE